MQAIIGQGQDICIRLSFRLSVYVIQENNESVCLSVNGLCQIVIQRYIYIYMQKSFNLPHMTSNTMQTTPEMKKMTKPDVNQTNTPHVDQQKTRSDKQVCKSRNSLTKKKCR